MENRSHALIAGVFILVMSIAMVFILFWMGGKNEETRRYLIVTTEAVKGLNPQARVLYYGVRVGNVESIDFDKSDMRRIVIGIRIRAEIPIRKTTIARLGFQGITGIAHVELDDAEHDNTDHPAPPIDEALAASFKIPMRASVVSEFMNTGVGTLHSAQKLLVALNELLNPENRRAISKTFSHLEALASDLKILTGEFRELFGEDNRLAIRTLLKNSNLAFQEAGRFFRDGRTLFERWSTLAEKLTRALGNSANGGLSTLTPRANELLGELIQTSRELSRVLQKLEASPQSFIFGGEKTAPGPGETGFTSP